MTIKLFNQKYIEHLVIYKLFTKSCKQRQGQVFSFDESNCWGNTVNLNLHYAAVKKHYS